MKPKLPLVLLMLVCFFLSTRNNGNVECCENLMAQPFRRFPGISRVQMEQLLKAKENGCTPSGLDSSEAAAIVKSTKGKCWIPLPTWLPKGFSVERVVTNVGKDVSMDSMKLSITYSRKTASGKKQAFIIEAEWEHSASRFNDPYFVETAIGLVILYYEPLDDKISPNESHWGKKFKNEVITELISDDSTSYPEYIYTSCQNFLARENVISVDKFEKISLQETKKILASLQKL